MSPARFKSERRAFLPVSALTNIRFRDTLVLQGLPLMGLGLAWSPGMSLGTSRLLLFLLASWSLSAHVFCVNDWAGSTTDQDDVNKAGRTFLARGVTNAQMAILSVILATVSLCLFGAVSWWSLLIAAAIVGLSFLYSHPTIGGKATPGMSSLLHVVGGGAYFLLGYAFIRSADSRGVLLALYFGLIFAAGHLSQEVADHDADRRAGLRTTAVRFGPACAFAGSFALFTASVVFLVGLGVSGIVSLSLVLAPAATYPLHALLYRRALRDGLTFEVMDRYRARYRVLYAVIGLAMIGSLLS